jgi:Acetyltransferases
MPAMTCTAKVRIARPEDRQSLIEIQRRASLAVQTGEVLRRLIEESEHIDLDNSLLAMGQVVLAEIGAIPVGFASFIVENGSVELDGMFVDPSHWRLGIGRMILNAVEHEMMARNFARIRVVSSLNAVVFYQSAGFTVVGVERTPLGLLAPVLTKMIASC